MIKLLAAGEDIMPLTNDVSYNAQNNAVGQDISFESLYDMPVGTVLSLYIDGVCAFLGIVITKVKSKVSISYTAVDFGFYLKNETTIQFNDISTDEAIEKLMADFDVKCSCEAIPTLVNEFFIDQSLENIINSLLKKAEADTGKQYGKRMEGETLKIFEIKKEFISPAIILGESNITESMDDMKNKVIVINDENESGQILAEKSDSNSIKKHGLLQEIVSVQKNESPNKTAENLLKEKNKVKKTVSVSLLVQRGGAEIKAGKIIKLNCGDISGTYEIKSASHDISKNKHTADVTLEAI